MDMDLVLKELELERSRELAATHEPSSNQYWPSLASVTARLETAIAALKSVREDATVADLVPTGRARLDKVLREVSPLLAELLALRAEEMPTVPGGDHAKVPVSLQIRRGQSGGRIHV